MPQIAAAGGWSVRSEDHAGGRQFFAWHHLESEGRFFGGLSDPMPLTVHADGSLSIQTPEAHAEPRTGRS